MRRATIGPFAALSPAQRAESLQSVLAEAPDRRNFWLFAYGSLMWKPDFEPAERRPGTLKGCRRALNVWTALARGTPRHPGLALGLAPGGECRGMLLRVRRGGLEQDLAAVWDREMHTGVYRPAWRPVDNGGESVTALCFVPDPGHPQFARVDNREQAARSIARAVGKFGSCRDYLAETLDALHGLGIAEPALSRLLVRVDQLSEADDRSGPD